MKHRDSDLLSRKDCKLLIQASIQQYHNQLLSAGYLTIPENVKKKAEPAIIPAKVELITELPRIES